LKKRQVQLKNVMQKAFSDDKMGFRDEHCLKELQNSNWILDGCGGKEVKV
jgi:hypothetical protein